jgi:hypothetical protein
MNIPFEATSQLRGIVVTARGINSVTNNSVTNNSATNPALVKSTDLAESLETTSPLGLDLLEKDFDSYTQPSGIVNPAQCPVWGIKAQLCKRRSQRPTFHCTIQFLHQVDTLGAMLTTIYTYPYDRLREYKPLTAAESALYQIGRDDPEIMIGRVMSRGRKGQICDDLQAVVSQNNNEMQLVLMYANWNFVVPMTQDPTPMQQVNYLKTGSWGNQLQLQSTRRSFSILDCPTKAGDCA